MRRDQRRRGLMRLRHGERRGAGADAERTVGGGTVGHALLLGLRDIKGKTGDSRVVTLFERRSVILLSPSPRARPGVPLSPPFKIGRASCRERVCQYV